MVHTAGKGVALVITDKDMYIMKCVALLNDKKYAVNAETKQSLFILK